MSAACDLLTHQQSRVDPSGAAAVGAILIAIRDVERSVTTLAQWSNSRWDIVEPRSIPSDKRGDAEAAATTLSTLVAKRLVDLEHS
jgi:hypothetical protein